MLGLVLALAALVVGFYHVKEINHTLDKVDHVHQELTAQMQKNDATVAQVRERLSTRYLSNFPDFIPDIVKLVDGARSSVVIFCDLPGYGVFSDPESAGQYHDVLEQKQRQPNFRLELTCMDDKTRRNYIEEQFSTFDWKMWQADPALRARLETFAASRGLNVQSLQTPASLIAAILDADTETFKHTFLGKAVRTDAPMPMYFWIADDKSAIFAVPALTSDAIEYGFTTSDRDLIIAFKNMKRRYDEAVTRRAITKNLK